MGKLSTIARAARGAEEKASKARVVERSWAENATRKGQLKGLQEYFEHNDPGAKSKPKAAPQPEPRERRTGTKPKLDLRRRAADAEALAGGYRAYADEMDADPRLMQYFVDANKLKALNDNYGFSVGDRLIELQNQYLQDEISRLDPGVKAIMARGPGDEVFLAGNDDAIMREAIERANNRLITEGVHMDLPGGRRRTIAGVSSLKYGAGPTLDDAEADLLARKSSVVDDRGDASEAIEVLEEPRHRDEPIGNLSTVRKYLGFYGGGQVSLSDQYPDAFEGEYEDGDEYLGEDDAYEYYACGGQVEGYLFGGLKKAAKKIGKGVKKVAKVVSKAAPVIGMIPGVGTLAAGAIGGLSGLISEGNLKGALSGAMGGVSGGLGGSLASGVASKLGGSALAKLGGTLAGDAASGILQKTGSKLLAPKIKNGATSSQSGPSAGQSAPSVDLARLRQQAIEAQAALPSQLSRVQQTAPRVQPRLPSPTEGLLQQIQRQQAA